MAQTVYVGDATSIIVYDNQIVVYQSSEQVVLDEPLINAVLKAIEIFRNQSTKD